jgi:hypothetical protein
MVTLVIALCSGCAIADLPDSGSTGDATDAVVGRESGADAAPSSAPDAMVSVHPDATDAAHAAAEAGCASSAGMDPSTLPSCCTAGHAHCVPSADVSASQASHLSACAGGYCVPDTFIRSGGTYAPRHCTSLGGADGACESVCIPDVAAVMGALPQDICASDERCAPCINPFDMMPTGACDAIDACTSADAGAAHPDAGATDGARADASPDGSPDAGPPVCPHVGPPVVDPSTLPTCCSAGGAHCVPSAFVPASEASRLATCTGGYCAPDPFIAAGGEYIPPTCTPFPGGEGRCLSVCLPDVAAQPSLQRATCGATERCVPCTDPFTGAPTGACTLSCDPGPRLPAVRFPSCCDARATCVPDSLLTPDQIDHLEGGDCDDGQECVPNEDLDPSFHAPACSGVNLFTGDAYTGFCVSDCADLTLLGRLTLDQGTCSGHHTCVPCINPLTGSPTGAPGC